MEEMEEVELVEGEGMEEEEEMLAGEEEDMERMHLVEVGAS